jgi:hypothetical protein
MDRYRNGTNLQVTQAGGYSQPKRGYSGEQDTMSFWQANLGGYCAGEYLPVRVQFLCVITANYTKSFAATAEIYLLCFDNGGKTRVVCHQLQVMFVIVTKDLSWFQVASLLNKRLKLEVIEGAEGTKEIYKTSSITSIPSVSLRLYL